MENKTSLFENELIQLHSEMNKLERKFVIDIIKKYKPKKNLEIGVAAGANSALILDYIEKNNLQEEVLLHSIDYSSDYYRERSKKTGFLVDLLVPHLVQLWNFFLQVWLAITLTKLVEI